MNPLHRIEDGLRMVRATGSRLDLGRIRESRPALLGMIFIIVAIFMAVFAPLLAPYGPSDIDLGDRLASPTWEHPMGTDELGRDVLSRVFHGAKWSLGIAVLVVAVTSSLGTVLGLVAGYMGGVIDGAVMRLVDTMLAFPSIILALVISGLLGAGFENLVIALALTQWPAYTRLVRGLTISIKEMDFVESARAIRASRLRILFMHIFPNSSHSVIVLATIDMAHTIIYAAALSFLGLGIQSPTPEWGAMLRSGVTYLFTDFHVSFFPGLMIVLTTLSFNFVGDWLRDTLDPHRQETLGVRG
jgi:peptide/nickel transport system permease protein